MKTFPKVLLVALSLSFVILLAGSAFAASSSSTSSSSSSSTTTSTTASATCNYSGTTTTSSTSSTSSTNSSSTVSSTTSVSTSKPVCKPGPPEDTLILSMTSITFAFVSNLLILRFVDLKAERRMKAEIDQYTKDLRAAQKSGDKKTEEKLKKKQQTIAQMRLKMSGARTKVTFITFIPFLLLYYLILSFVAPVAAYAPFYIPYIMMSVAGPKGGYEVTTFGWYLISSLSFSGIVTRLLKTQP
jgi:uncharacterized membrane protein (DUF106 family)